MENSLVSSDGIKFDGEIELIFNNIMKHSISKETLKETTNSISENIINMISISQSNPCCSKYVIDIFRNELNLMKEYVELFPRLDDKDPDSVQNKSMLEYLLHYYVEMFDLICQNISYSEELNEKLFEEVLLHFKKQNREFPPDGKENYRGDIHLLIKKILKYGIERSIPSIMICAGDYYPDYSHKKRIYYKMAALLSCPNGYYNMAFYHKKFLKTCTVINYTYHLKKTEYYYHLCLDSKLLGTKSKTELHYQLTDFYFGIWENLRSNDIPKNISLLDTSIYSENPLSILWRICVNFKLYKYFCEKIPISISHRFVHIFSNIYRTIYDKNYNRREILNETIQSEISDIYFSFAVTNPNEFIVYSSALSIAFENDDHLKKLVYYICQSNIKKEDLRPETLSQIKLIISLKSILSKQIDLLDLHFKYSPDSEGYENAKRDFFEISK